MIAERPLRVLGVDGMKGGWVGVLLETGNRPQGFSAPTIAGLADHAGAVDVVSVDIPIGLGATNERSADRLARRELGSLKSAAHEPASVGGRTSFRRLLKIGRGFGAAGHFDAVPARIFAGKDRTHSCPPVNEHSLRVAPS